MQKALRHTVIIDFSHYVQRKLLFWWFKSGVFELHFGAYSRCERRYPYMKGCNSGASQQILWEQVVTCSAHSKEHFKTNLAEYWRGVHGRSSCLPDYHAVPQSTIPVKACFTCLTDNLVLSSSASDGRASLHNSNTDNAVLGQCNLKRDRICFLRACLNFRLFWPIDWLKPRKKQLRLYLFIRCWQLFRDVKVQSSISVLRTLFQWMRGKTTEHVNKGLTRLIRFSSISVRHRLCKLKGAVIYRHFQYNIISMKARRNRWRMGLGAIKHVHLGSLQYVTGLFITWSFVCLCIEEFDSQ